MTSKTCVKCKETKLFEHFGKHNQMKDGYLNTCKSCIREYRKGWYKENRECDLERHKKYYEENKEHIKARVRKNWNDNADEINTKRRELYKTDDEYRTKRLEQCEKYRKEKRPENRKNRRKNNEAWRMEQVCRTRLWKGLKLKVKTIRMYTLTILYRVRHLIYQYPKTNVNVSTIQISNSYPHTKIYKNQIRFYNLTPKTRRNFCMTLGSGIDLPNSYEEIISVDTCMRPARSFCVYCFATRARWIVNPVSLLTFLCVPANSASSSFCSGDFPEY